MTQNHKQSGSCISRGSEVDKKLAADARGAVTLEWALLLAAIGLPLLTVMWMCVDLVVLKYRFISQMISLP